MSTFNGIVDEFPEIRIDYFRYHPGKTLPSACFLSHVHSDHLQGLESLKMPFVYCSTATKRILLRMEKYPHRINFAKGILEARKQTYKSLKMVLRSLPLETPVEIELGPKSKIRVTLFDANHCPGSVMFLIESLDKAVLYTGDVRAEPWWVNSLVRNPILLPYSCGVKRLDCIYLDTTFASRSDIYEHFPTKAEGLKELLTKVSKFPKSSIFYFRSWTLGYEDIWIALSNFLQSYIHVDDYQLRLFRSLADDTHSTDRGPVLAGFTFGNQQQLGCLTNNNEVSIHSCEPGTDCHDRIKKKPNIVWITPIISRLKDGTEIAEIGAGGGGGDLYQTPELEVIDEATFSLLIQLCSDNSGNMAGLAKLGEALATARALGQTNVPLEGLELDQDEEISLKQFLELVAKKDTSTIDKAKPVESRTIHFPYSRHSSYSELCHLISSLRPKDICPCTVDIDTWTEEVSMQGLFGDLCPDGIFSHDRATRSQAAERQEMRGRKRKREEITVDSQETQSQDSTDTHTAYRSAQTSLRKEEDRNPAPRSQEVNSAPSIFPKVPTPVRGLQKTLYGYNRMHDTAPPAIEMSCNTDQTINQQCLPTSLSEDQSTTTRPSTIPPPTAASVISIDSDDDGDDDDEVSLNDNDPYSTRSPSLQPIDLLTSNQDGPGTARFPQSIGLHNIDTDPRLQGRRRAYTAARLALDTGDVAGWMDLRLRSVGWKGHCEEEVELG